MTAINRRNFLKTSIIGGLALAYARPFEAFASPVQLNDFDARVALTTGDNRADLAFRALQPFSKEVASAIGNKRVVLKPNNVSIDLPLCATHVDTLEGILEFLKSIEKLDNVIIAESAANGPTFDGFSNYGYYNLIKKYPVKLVDLDQEPIDLLYVFDEEDFRPHALRTSNILLDSNSYIVSVARMKTHDRVLATLSLKNIVVGAPIKDKGFTWSRSSKPGAVNDKPIIHGSGFRGINYNLYALSRKLHPHLAVIDGFEGMEGNGPNSGTPVDHRVCVASTDWLAADRVAIELMGIDFAKVGYLNFCAQTGAGVADLNKIEVIGERLNDHIKSYKLSDNINSQLIWMNPA
ncbi:MAG TPA: DUF362 domain-containing protein [Bacteroidales bacterium]|nr:DUF362 domain-containing protein [Bacteroidales bacterium]